MALQGVWCVDLLLRGTAVGCQQSVHYVRTCCHIYAGRSKNDQRFLVRLLNRNRAVWPYVIVTFVETVYLPLQGRTRLTSSATFVVSAK
jgi:hypothetical protein